MATSSLERDLGEPTPVADSLGDVFYRLRLRGAYTRLEPDDGKLSRPVLRGGSGSNAVPLPDPAEVGGGRRQHHWRLEPGRRRPPFNGGR